MTPTTKSDSQVVVACVVDRDARFHLEVLRWYVSCVELAGLRPIDLIVHLVGEPSLILSKLSERGVRVVGIGPFDSRRPQCNKISGAQALAAAPLADGTRVVFTDADVIIAEDPRSVPVEPGAIGCKVVDGPNPPVSLLREIFDRAGIRWPGTTRTDFVDNEVTVRGNANGGVYVVALGDLRRICPMWARWARWLLDGGLLGGYEYHVDQVAMALALEDGGIVVTPLPRRWNLPIHIREWLDAAQPAPAIVHYHTAVDASGAIRLTGVSEIDGVITSLNRAVVAFLRKEGIDHTVAPAPATSTRLPTK